MEVNCNIVYFDGEKRQQIVNLKKKIRDDKQLLHDLKQVFSEFVESHNEA